MQIILHLGGTPQRAETAARLAASMAGSIVVVSSEGDGFYQWYDAAGIARERIIVDTAAWDTVTNFTHTYKLLKSLNCSRLYVVTSMFHCYRSMLIALACWGGRVPIVIVPHGIDTRESDERIAFADFARGLCWRIFGLIPFSKEVREQRVPGYELSNEHGREIGF
jgi:uncharacterized SAM-binding protein YcdF (DUF218 family)